MTRTRMLVTGAFLYAIFAADAIIHISFGDWAYSVFAVIAVIIGTAFIAMLRVIRRRSEATG